MKAIVLSCDKYHPLADLMIHTYQKLWPDNPFVFRVPYNDAYPQLLKDKYKEKIELIKSPAPIKETMRVLLSDIADEEWVYWCMDDRYLIKLKAKEAGYIYKRVLNITDPTIIAVRFHRFKKFEGNDKYYKKDQRSGNH